MKSYEHRSIGRFMDTKKYGVQKLRLVVTILFLVNMMRPTSAHPAPEMIRINQPNQRRTPFDSLLSYTNPCSGKDIEPSGNAPTKQDNLQKLNAFRALKKVKESLTLTKSNFDQLNMAVIYKATMNLKHQLMDQNLPDGKHKTMDSDISVQKFLVEFYNDLILYAKAFYKLSAMIPNFIANGHNIEEKRNVIMSYLKNNLKGLRCEVYSHITGNLTDHFPKKRLEKIGSEWRHAPDSTDFQTIDMSVFVTYKRFLRNWSVRSKSLLRRLKSTQLQKRQKKSSKFNKKRTVRERKVVRHHRSSLSPRTVL